jgi:hypothetical protein
MLKEGKCQYVEGSQISFEVITSFDNLKRVRILYAHHKSGDEVFSFSGGVVKDLVCEGIDPEIRR